MGLMEEGWKLRPGGGGWARVDVLCCGDDVGVDCENWSNKVVVSNNNGVVEYLETKTRVDGGGGGIKPCWYCNQTSR